MWFQSHCKFNYIKLQNSKTPTSNSIGWIFYLSNGEDSCTCKRKTEWRRLKIAFSTNDIFFWGQIMIFLWSLHYRWQKIRPKSNGAHKSVGVNNKQHNKKKSPAPWSLDQGPARVFNPDVTLTITLLVLPFTFFFWLRTLHFFTVT